MLRLRLVSTIILTLLFTLCSVKLFSQEQFEVNGRTLTKIDGNYFDITTSDTLKIDQKTITVQINSNNEQEGINKILENFACRLVGKLRPGYYALRIDEDKDLVEFLININQESNVVKSFISYPGVYSSGGHWPIEQGTHETWYLGSDAYGDPNDLDEEYLCMESAWNITTGDSNIIVGLIDSGTMWGEDDPDFPPDNHLGYNFLTMSTNTHPNTYSAGVYSEHGTENTSIISSRTNNNLKIWGVAGGWPGESSGITPMMVVNQEHTGNGTSPEHTALAIVFAARHGARIINMPFHWDETNPANTPGIDQVRYAIDSAILINPQIIFVASAGNDGLSRIMFPANYEPVIAVSGCTNAYSLSGEQNNVSNYGPEILCTAPGTSIWVNRVINPFNPGGSIVSGTNGGTSYSATIVSGIISLMLSVNPCLSRDEVKEIIKQSCYKGGTYTYTNGRCDQLGYGFINAKNAVNLAMGEPAMSISGTVTWNSNRTFRGNITIEPGGQLTLQNMTLRMWKNTNIIVSTNGILNVVNSTITGNCDDISDMWNGIIVQGDPSKKQAPFYNSITGRFECYQGRIALSGNSVVEHALCGTSFSSNGGTSGGGGFITTSGDVYFRNNTVAISYAPYSRANLSSIVSTHFVVNENYRGGIWDSSMVYLNGVKNLIFNGCYFEYLRAGNSMGEGIYCNSSSTGINGVCSSQISPCTSYRNSVFANLRYGIKALNVTATSAIKVNHSTFNMNTRGILLSSCNYAEILNSTFHIPEFSSIVNLQPFGLYFNNCTGYHVESDTFNSASPSTSGNIGVYTRNSGGSQNYIYNNTFTNLSRGAVADGNNRISGGATGLCYKCNTFATNGTDIDVVVDHTPVLAIDGIRKNQGMPFFTGCLKPDTLPAANVFSAQAMWSIKNENGNQIFYYHHTYSTPLYLKVIPYPVTTSTINNYPVANTRYDRATICKSWIKTGGIISTETLRDEKEEAKQQAESTELLLENTIDGGNTTNLNWQVLGTPPTEALALRDELIQKSPYLSDTVMKTAIEKEDVLPNAMIRDILAENPQSAKSDEIMSKIDERWEPMPDYMKEEIEVGKTIIGGKEQLEAKRDGFKQQESYLFNQIVGAYLNDTVNPDAVEELEAFLQSENSVDADFTLAQVNIRQGDYSNAAQTISTLQGNTGLDAAQQQLATDYSSLISILASLEADTIGLNDVDSAHAIPLFALYNSGENEATVLARNVLIASGLLHYEEPINGNDTTKSAVAQFPASRAGKSNRQDNEILNVFPNPANNYVIVEYKLPGNPSKAAITIRNSSGIVISEQTLAKAQDQLTIDTKSLPSGSYFVSIQVNGKNIISKPLSVIK